MRYVHKKLNKVAELLHKTDTTVFYRTESGTERCLPISEFDKLYSKDNKIQLYKVLYKYAGNPLYQETILDYAPKLGGDVFKSGSIRGITLYVSKYLVIDNVYP